MSTDSRKNQRSRILGLLVQAAGGWVSLTTILDLRISQYSARVFELRRMGFKIENKTERVDGRVHSWFRLEPSPRQAELGLKLHDQHRDEN